MSVRLVASAVALFCSSSFVAGCGGDQAANPPPLIPEAASASVNAPSTRAVPATRSLDSKTIGAEGFSPAAPNGTAARASGPAPASPANGAWSPTPVNGVMNPSPPAGTPVYGDMNPSPPGR
jgi:hypothetical protein